MISDRYDSSNDMNPTISPSNHPEIPYIYEMNFTKFEKSLIDIIKSNMQNGKLFCLLDINGNDKWKIVDFTYEKCAYRKPDSSGDWIKVRYILHFNDESNRYVDALKYMSDHWIPNVSKLKVAKFSNVVLDTSEMKKYSLKIPVSEDVEKRLNAVCLTPNERKNFDDVVIRFISDLVLRMKGTYDPTNDVLVWVKDHFEWRHAEVDVKVREPLDWNGDPNNPIKYAIIRSENPPEVGFEHAVIRSENPREDGKYGWKY